MWMIVKLCFKLVQLLILTLLSCDYHLLFNLLDLVLKIEDSILANQLVTVSVKELERGKPGCTNLRSTSIATTSNRLCLTPVFS